MEQRPFTGRSPSGMFPSVGFDALVINSSVRLEQRSQQYRTAVIGPLEFGPHQKEQDFHA